MTLIAGNFLSVGQQQMPRGTVVIVHPCANVQAQVADAAEAEGAGFARCHAAPEALPVDHAEGPACILADSKVLSSGDATLDRASQRRQETPLIVLQSESQETPSDAVWRRSPLMVLPPRPAFDRLRIAIRNGLCESRRRFVDRQFVESFRSSMSKLSNNELTVMQAVCEGKLNKQIAKELGVSIRTVEQRRRQVFAKMDVMSAVPLAARWATVQTIERFRGVHSGWSSPATSNDTCDV
ncbi:MAG: LuxR C-terminal-related transcriptional regulator [Planctomycetota bacterium]